MWIRLGDVERASAILAEGHAACGWGRKKLRRKVYGTLLRLYDEAEADAERAEEAERLHLKAVAYFCALHGRGLTDRQSCRLALRRCREVGLPRSCANGVLLRVFADLQGPPGAGIGGRAAGLLVRRLREGEGGTEPGRNSTHDMDVENIPFVLHHGCLSVGNKLNAHWHSEHWNNKTNETEQLGTAEGAETRARGDTYGPTGYLK